MNATQFDIIDEHGAHVAALFDAFRQLYEAERDFIEFAEMRAPLVHAEKGYLAAIKRKEKAAELVLKRQDLLYDAFVASMEAKSNG